ncbi:50S ribosomal protein L29 [Mesonia sp. K7]|uniref:50S ribosomal protein L29 n=1 Tax=Mesonia sp. K7 TaxID=2218606 RepID=UPI000DA7A8B7|nr:50S ribosomal protein L29 [Mesonia sp. K7]PZD77552.1 50S ribosomal protein L29 [Mesonia sp. K7]
MKQSEIKELSTEELQEKIVSSKQSYRDLKMAHTITPIENPSQIRGLRRSIARMETEITNRELNNSAE